MMGIIAWGPIEAVTPPERAPTSKRKERSRNMGKSIRRGMATSLGCPTTGGEEVYMMEEGGRSDDIFVLLLALS
jgi:hypothetical protein